MHTEPALSTTTTSSQQQQHHQPSTVSRVRRSRPPPAAYRNAAAYYPAYAGPSRREICVLTVSCICLLLCMVAFTVVSFARAGVLTAPEGSFFATYKLFQQSHAAQQAAMASRLGGGVRGVPKQTEYIEMDPARRTMPPLPPRNYSAMLPSPSEFAALPRIAIISLNHQAPAKRVVRIGQRWQDAQFVQKSSSDWMHPMSYANKAAYCKKWGYDLIIEDSTLVDPARDPAWGKVPILRKWLPKYQWVMWVDMDAFFMRFDLPATELLPEAEGSHDMVMAKDWHGINLGIFLMRNSAWSMRLLDLMWHTPPRWWKPWEEQSAFSSLLNPMKTGPTALELEKRILIRNQREMNSYGAEFAYGNVVSRYQEEDRLVHFPNCKGIPTCRSTVKKFFILMCARNGLPTNIVLDAPPKVVPAPRSSEAQSSLPTADVAAVGGNAMVDGGTEDRGYDENVSTTLPTHTASRAAAANARA